MKQLLIFLFTVGLLVGCGGTTSQNPLAEYFYPLDNEPMIYVFRDKVKGLDERFHRIYRIDDSFGEHIVVEIYASDARLLEAYNYNIDSLNLMDHMVVNANRQNTKGELEKTQYFPFGKNAKGTFLSRFPADTDSTYLEYAITRTRLPKKAKKLAVLEKQEETIVFKDEFTLSKNTSAGVAYEASKGQIVSYFSKGYGLTRWHDPKKTYDFVLEKIITETEFAKLLSN